MDFNDKYYFHWADFLNQPVNDWKDIASELLSIPMAHQIIGYYTVADKTDGVLKVMRSYQYWAASKVLSAFLESRKKQTQRGGYIWHTTGSGKTMTSFKSAQLIADTGKADKVIFLMDRIELGCQSLDAYNNFADDNTEVQGTKNTNVLISKLKSDEPKDTLIVTSIQKLSRIKKESYIASDIEKIVQKDIVIIVDEAIDQLMVRR